MKDAEPDSDKHVALNGKVKVVSSNPLSLPGTEGGDLRPQHKGLCRIRPISVPEL